MEGAKDAFLLQQNSLPQYANPGESRAKTEKEAQAKLYRGAVREVRPSLLDQGCPNSPVQVSGFRGFINLCYMAVVVYVFTYPIVHYNKTGRLIDPSVLRHDFVIYAKAQSIGIISSFPQLAEVMFRDFPLLLSLWGFLFCYSFTFFLIFKSFYRGYFSKFSTRAMQCVLQITMLATTTSICHYNRWSVLPTAFSMIVTFILIMKTHSFMDKTLTMFDAELTEYKPESSGKVSGSEETSRKKEGPLSSIKKREPSLMHFAYFLVCPVIVYEEKYPKASRFRPLYLIHKILQMILGMVALYFLSGEMLIPLVKASEENSVDAYLRLILPMLVASIVFFYVLFDCICNIFAEVTYFGDREFYSDWWNSTDYSEFSRKWNRPVHEFLFKHVYLHSMEKLNISSTWAAVLTFVISALAHEFIIGICFKAIRFWLFGLMMLEILLILFCRFWKNTIWGNCIFWIFFVLGVPLIALVYGSSYQAWSTI